jgi:hypothetical protein
LVVVLLVEVALFCSADEAVVEEEAFYAEPAQPHNCLFASFGDLKDLSTP